MVALVPSLLTWYSPYACVNQLNEVEKPSKDGWERAKEKREQRIRGQKEGEVAVLNNYWEMVMCSWRRKQHNSLHEDLIRDVCKAENQSLFRWYLTVSSLHTNRCTHTHTHSHTHPHTHTHTHTHQKSIPALELQTLSTQLCAGCWCYVCWAVRAEAATDCWKQRAVKANSVEGGRQRVDWWDSVAHTGCGAQVLTCNYGPFIGHNVNYTAEEHTAHNIELLNHNHLKETCVCWNHTWHIVQLAHVAASHRKIMNDLKWLYLH